MSLRIFLALGLIILACGFVADTVAAQQNPRLQGRDGRNIGAGKAGELVFKEPGPQMLRVYDAQVLPDQIKRAIISPDCADGSRAYRDRPIRVYQLRRRMLLVIMPCRRTDQAFFAARASGEPTIVFLPWLASGKGITVETEPGDLRWDSTRMRLIATRGTDICQHEPTLRHTYLLDEHVQDFGSNGPFRLERIEMMNGCPQSFGPFVGAKWETLWEAPIWPDLRWPH